MLNVNLAQEVDSFLHANIDAALGLAAEIRPQAHVLLPDPDDIRAALLSQLSSNTWDALSQPALVEPALLLIPSEASVGFLIEAAKRQGRKYPFAIEYDEKFRRSFQIRSYASHLRTWHAVITDVGTDLTGRGDWNRGPVVLEGHEHAVPNSKRFEFFDLHAAQHPGLGVLDPIAMVALQILRRGQVDYQQQGMNTPTVTLLAESPGPRVRSASSPFVPLHAARNVMGRHTASLSAVFKTQRTPKARLRPCASFVVS